MPDPLDVLRQQPAPLAPRPEFTRELRARLEAALGGAMTATAAPATFQSLNPYIAVRDAVGAIAWYRDVFDAVESGNRYTEASGRIGHAELTIFGSVLMLSDEYPDFGAVAPTGGGVAVSLHLTVPDVDETVARASRAGAIVERGPSDEAYGARSATIRDPFGHRWMVQTPITDREVPDMQTAMPDYTAAPPSRQGELFYLTMHVRDGARAARFFGALFGWRPEVGHSPDGFNVNAGNQHLGLLGGDPDPSVDLYFVVDDLDAAISKVRELGGSAEAAETYDSGGMVLCHDDQGTPFYLSLPAPGY